MKNGLDILKTEQNRRQGLFGTFSDSKSLCFILPGREVFAPFFTLLIKLQMSQLTETPPFMSLFQQRYGLKMI